MNNNPFRRFAYSPVDSAALRDRNLFAEENESQVVFSGADLQAFVNQIKVGNLETITFSTSREVMGNYVMGRADCVQYTKGKRVIVGSLMFAQYDKHALLEQVFKMSKRGISTYGDLWDTRGVGNRLRNQVPVNYQATTSGGAGSRILNVDPSINSSVYDANGVLRGLSQAEFQLQLDDQSRQAADLKGATKLNYPDQIPPFDLTLVGISPSGRAARCTIFGIDITQETGGWSMTDLGNSVGFSFVARAVNPWRPIDDDALVHGAVGSVAGLTIGR